MKNINKIIEDMEVLVPTSLFLDSFVIKSMSSPHYRIAFDSTDSCDESSKEVCINIISDSSIFNKEFWTNYEMAIIAKVKEHISKEDAVVPLTKEQEEMFINALQMMLL